ncbi:MAG: serine/threonine protein kinase [Gammaproteobacteria bacterium]|nr:serine/threonine protein kinase [Gammaproteobacteria bacterium]
MSTLLEELNINNTKLTARDVQEGFTLKDRFVLETKIGTGGMGTVYKARDKRKEEAGIKNPFIAIKIVNDHYKEHPKVFQTLQMEAAKAQALAHSNIVRIYDFDRDGDIAFITMEYLKGCTLKQMLETADLQNLSQAQKIALMNEIAAALIYMHQQGYAHADLKPSNIFITDNLEVKLIDFGFSSSALTADIAPDADSILTYSPLYASYEILNNTPASKADDVYALACVTYELLSGIHPYQKKTAQQAYDTQIKLAPITTLNKNQWRALEKGLAIKREQRYDTVEQFVHDFNITKMGFFQRLLHLH